MELLQLADVFDLGDDVVLEEKNFDVATEFVDVLDFFNFELMESDL